MKIDSRQEERFWIRNIMEICCFLNPSVSGKLNSPSLSSRAHFTSFVFLGRVEANYKNLVYIYIYIYIESNNIVRLGFKLRSTSAIATICNIVVVVASTTTSHHYCRVILNHVYGRNRNYV